MSVAIRFVYLIAFFMISISNILASGTEWYGKAEGEIFTVAYEQDEKNVFVDSKKEHAQINLSGHTAKDFHIRDIDGDGNDEIIFLDQTGASVGGELRIFYWLAGKAVEIDEEYYANRITLKHNQKLHVLLWQHDTENLYFCSEILSFQQGKLSKEKSHRVWNAIIMDYKKAIASEKRNWRKSRYYAYMAMTHQNLGDKTKAEQFFNKARRLDDANPFVQRNL